MVGSFDAFPLARRGSRPAALRNRPSRTPTPFRVHARSQIAISERDDSFSWYK
ncbi:hypothetical protein T484DRAFT_1925511 [Baffinella frigidus]|nr:hypothetical protein T484DRAFT_1925511 [Cryptophyta sp. CCMP2293]